MTHGEVRLERTTPTQGFHIVDTDCGEQTL